MYEVFSPKTSVTFCFRFTEREAKEVCERYEAMGFDYEKAEPAYYVLANGIPTRDRFSLKENAERHVSFMNMGSDTVTYTVFAWRG